MCLELAVSNPFNGKTKHPNEGASNLPLTDLLSSRRVAHDVDRRGIDNHAKPSLPGKDIRPVPKLTHDGAAILPLAAEIHIPVVLVFVPSSNVVA